MLNILTKVLGHLHASPTRASVTFHSKSIAINMELVPTLQQNSFHSSAKDSCKIPECVCGKFCPPHFIQKTVCGDGHWCWHNLHSSSSQRCLMEFDGGLELYAGKSCSSISDVYRPWFVHWDTVMLEYKRISPMEAYIVHYVLVCWDIKICPLLIASLSSARN